MNRLRSIPSIALLALGGTGSIALAADSAPAAPKPPQATIPFVQHGSIRDWQADKREGLWVQDIRKQWYYAKLMGTCTGLDFALSIAFDTRGNNSLDRFAQVVVPGEPLRCPISSFTKSDPPPAGKRHPSKDDDKAADTPAAATESKPAL
jgi:hypothetical protein